MQTSAVENVSSGQRTRSSAAVNPSSCPAFLANGTSKRDSRTSLPVIELRLIFFAGIERFSMFLPLILSAAYDEPPSAMNTASVDITLAYVRRCRSLLCIRLPASCLLQWSFSAQEPMGKTSHQSPLTRTATECDVPAA